MPLLNLETFCIWVQRSQSGTPWRVRTKGIGFCFLDQNGRFLARVGGITRGNILLHKEQYRVSEDEKKSCAAARPMIAAKIFNARCVLMRGMRDHPLSVDSELFQAYTEDLLRAARDAMKAESPDELRG